MTSTVPILRQFENSWKCPLFPKLFQGQNHLKPQRQRGNIEAGRI